MKIQSSIDKKANKSSKGKLNIIYFGVGNLNRRGGAI